METVEHHGRTTAYRVVDRGGSATPLLLVHGSGGSHQAWRPLFRLVDERPVVALDLSGHGESDDTEAAPGFETLSAYADDVLAVAAATDAAVLGGHSLGGAVALHVAIEREAFRPDALVLASTGARLAVLESLREWLAVDFGRALEFLHEPGHLFADPDDQTVQASRAVLQATGRRVTERDFLTCHEFDVRDRLDEVESPALAIVGEEDRLTPPRYHEYLASELPDAALAVIEDAAHMPMLEQPRAFCAALERFLDDLA